MTKLNRLALVMAGLALMSGSSFGYYHYLHFAGRSAPYTSIPEKFDLSALPNKTVNVFVSDIGLTPTQQGDSYAAVLSEIRMAIQTWNAVDTSDLRVAFGGLSSVGTPQNTPAVQVIFDDVPPGLLAYTVNTHGNSNGSFVPVSSSTTVLKRDLSGRSSSGEAVFLTIVHELGHALGLQHTIASSAMSTEVTRATTKAKPLSADDIAGISVLYPAQNFSSRFGAIAGRVTLSGAGVSLASVAAFSPNSAAVTTLTNPDGAYRLDGLVPGSYQLYVHPLPPNYQAGMGPDDVVMPVDLTGRALSTGALFQTQFYPGTTNWMQAATVPVSAGASTDGINFAVQARSSLQVYDVTTYSYPNSFAVKPAYLTNFASASYFVAAGAGLIGSNSAPVNGLNVSVVGGVPVRDLRPYTSAYMIVDLGLNAFSGNGPRHVVFSLGNDLYVLPSGMTLTDASAPAVTSAIPGFDPSSGARIATITGSNFTSSTRIYFDGLPASIRGIDTGNGVIVVTPPPAAAGYQANVVALNGDGQSSLFTNAAGSYAYDPAAPPSIAVTPNTLPAGTEAMVDVTGVNTNFTDGATVLGLGSSDVLVKRLWVLSPTHLIATVSISPAAPSGQTQISVVSGFQVINQPFGFQIQPYNSRLPVINSQLVNPATGQPSVFAGGLAVMTVTNLAATATTGNLSLTVGGVNTPILAVAFGQITFQVPNLPVGPAVLSLQDGINPIQPVVAAIDPAPPSIVSIVSGLNTVIDTNNPAHPGDIVNLLVSSLSDPGAIVSASRIHVLVAGIDHPPFQDAQPSGNGHQVGIMLSPAVPTGFAPVTIGIDGRTSLTYMLAIRSF